MENGEMSKSGRAVIVSSNPKLIKKYRIISVNIADPSIIDQLQHLFENKYRKSINRIAKNTTRN